MTRDSHSSSAETKFHSVAEAYLHHLKRQGVDYLYMGAGTDTAPIVEAYGRQRKADLDFPRAIVSGHESIAVGMAHGYYMVTGRPQAVMLHVTVGAANAVCGIMNAARAQVPIFFTAGRTPLFEAGRLGSRDGTIHWGQEMFDQAGMMRELVKWDYELRDGLNMTDVVDRGLSIAMTHPRGPVYLTLPREVLAQPMADVAEKPSPAVPLAPYPDPLGVARLAEALTQAETPVIVCTASGANPETVAMLAELSSRYGIAVSESKPRHVNFPDSHPLHAGFDINAILEHADALLFLEADVPWLPGQAAPRAGAFVAHAGSDPIFARYPVRSFPSALTITSTVEALLPALIDALAAAGAERDSARRTARMAAFAQARRDAVAARARADEERGGPITKVFLSRCLSEVRPADGILVNEYSAQRDHLRFEQAGTFFVHSNAAGLGWGMPAALGAQQAAPGRTVIAVVGDGAYLFGNPAAYHQAAAMHKLPVLTVIFDNGGWGAVQSSALAIYPDTHAAEYARENSMAPLSSLDPIPEFVKYAEASGGYGERVSKREDLLPALRRALSIVQTEGRQALLHVTGA